MLDFTNGRMKSENSSPPAWAAVSADFSALYQQKTILFMNNVREALN